MAGNEDPEGQKPDAEESSVQNPPDEGGHSEQTQEDDFDAGWSGEQPTSDDGEPAKDDDGEAATGEPGTTNKEDEPAQAGEKDEPDTSTREQDDDVDAQIAAKEKEIAEKKARLQKLQQEEKTWEGRLNKEQQKHQEGESSSQSSETEQQRQAREQVEESLSDEDKTFLENMRNEYPDVHKAVELMAKDMVGNTTREQLSGAVDQIRKEHIDPALQRVQETEQATHYAEIQRAHPDVGDYVQSGQLREWIESQPYKDAQQMLEIYEQGTPSQAIQLLDQFKQSQGINAQPAPDKGPDPRRQQQLEASTAVRRRSGGPPKTSSKDDFEAGWDMAGD